MFASDRTLDTPEPASPDVAKTDMLRCPRWLITHLVQARRAELASETKWRAMNEELNQTKLRLTQAKGLDAIKAKDGTIKKLNTQIQQLYDGMEVKTKELNEVKKEMNRKSQMMATSPPVARPGSGKYPALPVGPSRGSFGSSTGGSNAPEPEGSGSEAEEVKKLKAEILRLKMLMKIKPSSPTPRAGSNELSHHESEGSAVSSTPRVLAHQQHQSEENGRTLHIGTTGLAPPISPHRAEMLSPRAYEPEVVPFGEANFWLPPAAKRVALSTLLTDPSMSFVDLLGKAIATGNDADACTASLIALYQSQDTLMEVLEHLIRAEVNRCKSVNTLFRGEELSSRGLRSYVRSHGLDYAYLVLNDLVAEVSNKNYNFEVDPNRAEPSMNLKQNFASLEELTRFLDRILISYDAVPPVFLKLCKWIHDFSAVKFANEDYEQLVVAGFMFLRFICPAVAAPESFKLHPVATPGARRTLLLVGKVLQNLANGVEFKEDYLQDMNAFLKRNALPLSHFFKKLRTYPAELDGDAPFLVDLSKSVYNRRDKIKANVEPDMLSKKRWQYTVTTPLNVRVSGMLSSIQNLPTGTLSSRPDIIRSFSNMIMDNQELLTQVVKLLGAHNSSQENKQVAEAFVTLFYSAGQIGFMARVIVQNETANSAYEFLHQSFTKSLFNALAIQYCSPWLSGVIGELISNVVSQNTAIEVDGNRIADPQAKASFNREEALSSLKGFTNALLESLVAALALVLSGSSAMLLF